MRRYYGEQFWFYRYCGSQAKWPAGHLSAGNLDLGPSAGDGYENDRRYARHILRKRLGIKRLPARTQVYPRNHHLYSDRPM